MHEMFPYHLQGMEIYSTTLWQLEKEMELSALAQDLVDFDKESPEVILQKFKSQFDKNVNM